MSLEVPGGVVGQMIVMTAPDKDEYFCLTPRLRSDGILMGCHSGTYSEEIVMGVNGRFEFIKQKGLLHNPFSRR
jgi:hypothetical protein